MNIKQIRKATATKKTAAEARNAELYIKDMAEGLTEAETAEQEALEVRISDLNAILEELCTQNTPKLDANIRALVAANID